MRISKIKTTDGRTITENGDDLERLNQMLESGDLKPNAGPTPLGRRGKCPQCGSRSVAKIEYGMPGWDPRGEPRHMAGEVVLGGCCVTGDDPNRHCNHCAYDWRSRRSRADAFLDNRPLLDALLDSGVIRLERAAFLSEPPPRIPIIDLDRVEGMLLGLAIGDALGNTTEGMAPGARRAAHGEITGYLPNRHAEGRRVGTPSDDSQMAFWTLELLLADGRLVPEHLADCFSRREIFGIGKSVREFRTRLREEGRSWEEAGVHSAGNGAVMRIAPVLIPHLRAPSPAVWADAVIAGMVTHNDRTSNACCVALAALLWSALGFETVPAPEWWLKRFVAVAGPLEGDTELVPRCDPHRDSYRGSLTGFVSTRVKDALDAGRSVREVSDEFWSAAFLLETIPSVLAVLQRHADSPREAIVRAVNDTWDNDTVAAIVGAVVGALHGRKGLWIDGLLGRTGADDDRRVFKLIAQKKRFLRGAAAA